MLERTIARKQQQKIRLLNARISIAITNRETNTQANESKKKKSELLITCFDLFLGHDCVFLKRKDNKRLKLKHTHKQNNCIHFSVYCHTQTSSRSVFSCVYNVYKRGFSPKLLSTRARVQFLGFVFCCSLTLNFR